MRISALILTRNRPETALRCIQSVRGQDFPPHEILVLDNASETGREIDRMPREALKDCKLFRSSTNLGCPGGRNRLIGWSTGEVLMFVDDDGTLAPNVTKEVVRLLEANAGTGIITFRIEDPLTGEVRDGIIREKPFLHHTFAGGACAIRRRVLEEVGQYPEEYLRQGEEHDLAVRAIDAGFNIVYAPECTLWHGPSEAVRSAEVWRNVLLAPITTAWRYMPLHYAVARTGVNGVRLGVEWYRGRSDGRVWKKLLEGIRNGLLERSPISYAGYRRWRRLHQAIKRQQPLDVLSFQG